MSQEEALLERPISSVAKQATEASMGVKSVLLPTMVLVVGPKAPQLTNVSPRVLLRDSHQGIKRDLRRHRIVTVFVLPGADVRAVMEEVAENKVEMVFAVDRHGSREKYQNMGMVIEVGNLKTIIENKLPAPSRRRR